MALRTLGCTLVLGAVSACEGRAPTARKAQPPVPVFVARVQAPPLKKRVRLFAEVRSVERSDLGAEVAGRVAAVHRRVGATVREGDLLVTLDTQLARARIDELQAAATEVRAERALAEVQWQRLSRAGPTAVAASELDEARGRLDAATSRQAALQAQAEVARTLLAKHQVRAPYAGELVAVHVEVGSYLREGDVMMTLASGKRTEVWSYVTPAVARTLRPGTTMAVEATENATHEAGREAMTLTVEQVVAALSERGTTQLVRLTGNAEGASWVAGATLVLRHEMQVRGGGRAVVVPADALMTDAAGGGFVFAMRRGRAKRLPVRVVDRGESEALVEGARIEGALSVGDTLIVRGHERLRPGEKVRVVTLEDAS